MSAVILYSYRRCPYAMRARMALTYADIAYQVREISLRDKPASLLQISPKATVPVLQLADGTVLEQSLDIMHWALQQHDPAQWLAAYTDSEQQAMRALVAQNDDEFKAALDRYKYPERYPGHPMEVYRAQGEIFLQQLQARLSEQAYLFGSRLSYADIAIFPFVRQFARVDPAWFDATPYDALRDWLTHHCQSDLFMQIMQKYPTWQDD